LFLCAGSVTDPKKSFHLEFRLVGAERAKKAYSILLEQGFEPKILNKEKCVSIYFKTGDSIEDIITYFGANNSVFELINAKIEREIRNNEHRATNCVAQNIMKSVKASSRQFEAIEKIIYHGLFESLPEELRTTATLRYSNLDVSLSELAALHDPPISKSGLNHRLVKIMDFADSIK
jgi:DNA-binding protein WhiA